MHKNHCLAKSIMDAAWTDLTGKLTYKENGPVGR
jgi:hypothetical protein